MLRPAEGGTFSLGCTDVGREALTSNSRQNSAGGHLFTLISVQFLTHPARELSTPRAHTLLVPRLRHVFRGGGGRRPDTDLEGNACPPPRLCFGVQPPGCMCDREAGKGRLPPDPGGPSPPGPLLAWTQARHPPPPRRAPTTSHTCQGPLCRANKSDGGWRADGGDGAPHSRASHSTVRPGSRWGLSTPPR